MTFPSLPPVERDAPVQFDAHELALPAVLTGANATAVGEWLSAVAKTHNAEIAALDYVLVTDEYLHAMNVERLAHDTLTDIITFDLSEGGAESVEGECYISLPRVLENADAYGAPAEGSFSPMIAPDGGGLWTPMDQADRPEAQDQVRPVHQVHSPPPAAAAPRATPLSPPEQAELLRVIAHGLLHLCGLGDETSAEAEKMRAAEDAALYIWRSRFARPAQLG